MALHCQRNSDRTGDRNRVTSETRELKPKKAKNLKVCRETATVKAKAFAIKNHNQRNPLKTKSFGEFLQEAELDKARPK